MAEIHSNDKEDHCRTENVEIPTVDDVIVYNDPRLEEAFACKAVTYMEVYFNLICTNLPRELKLSNCDDEIYCAFKKDFPNFPLAIFLESDLKSENAKKEWRQFILQFEHKIEDPFFGCLLRFDCAKEYTCENTIFGVRVQHFAIEVARNREGLNDCIYSQYQKRSAVTNDS